MSVNGDADPYDGRDETEMERLDRNWEEILQELRVTLTGTQLITGFLLALAFQARFDEVLDDRHQLVIYLILVSLAALSTVVGVTPVILHRTYFRQNQKERIVRLSNRLLIAELVLVGLLTIGVAGFIFDVVVAPVAGLVAAVVATVVVVALWIVLPQTRKRMA